MSLSAFTITLLQGFTAAEWTASTRILQDYELGITSDTGIAKLGNGIDLWSALSPFDPSGGVSGAAWGSITGTLSAQSDLNTALGLKAPSISPTFTTPTLGVAAGTSIAVTGLVTTSSPTAAFGFATGAGGAVTQITNRTTGVTLNTNTGAITLISAAGSATPASFTVTNSAVAATDIVMVTQKSGTDLYEISVTAVATGSFRITSNTTGGTTTEQPVFNFVVIKGVAA